MAKVKYSTEQLITMLKSIGFTLLNSENYKNASSEINILDSDGYKYNTLVSRITSEKYRIAHPPAPFNKHNRSAIDNVKIWLTRNKPTLTLLSTTFEHCKTKVFFKCEVCEETFSTYLECVTTRYYGCPYCAGRRVGNKNNLAVSRPDIAASWDNEKNFPLTPWDVTPYCSKKVWWTCDNNPGHRWKTRISHRTNGCGCPMCKRSKGEKRIQAYLESHNIAYTVEQVWEGLLGTKGRFLRFDFYLLDYDIIIEYHGQFHDGNGNDYVKEQSKKVKIHDEIKEKYCKENNIALFKIWYYDFNKIEKILDDLFSDVVLQSKETTA